MTDKAILIATTAGLKTLVDDTVRVTIDFSPADREKAFQLAGARGVPLAVAALDKESTQKHAQVQTITAASEYGQEAKELRQSGFFRTPEVWRAIGTDKEFLAWVRNKNCKASNILEYGQCQFDIHGKGISEAAHVRRIADGAGTGIKPEYAAVPLCTYHHNLQHQQGESALGGKEQFDRWRIETVQQWAWETLKAQLGYDSWSEIPPPVLYKWAEKHELTKYLPEVYK